MMLLVIGRLLNFEQPTEVVVLRPKGVAAVAADLQIM